MAGRRVAVHAPDRAAPGARCEYDRNDMSSRARAGTVVRHPHAAEAEGQVLLVPLAGAERVGRLVVIGIVLVGSVAGARSKVADSRVDVLSVGGTLEMAISAEDAPKVPLIAAPACCQFCNRGTFAAFRAVALGFEEGPRPATAVTAVTAKADIRPIRCANERMEACAQQRDIRGRVLQA